MQLSHNRLGDETFRMERLCKLRNQLMVLPCLAIKIKSLHDHKGELTVTWINFHLITRLEKDIIGYLWDKYYNEINIIHE